MAVGDRVVTLEASKRRAAKAKAISTPRTDPDSGVPPDHAYRRPRLQADGREAPGDNVGQDSSGGVSVASCSTAFSWPSLSSYAWVTEGKRSGWWVPIRTVAPRCNTSATKAAVAARPASSRAAIGSSRTSKRSPLFKRPGSKAPRTLTFLRCPSESASMRSSKRCRRSMRLAKAANSSSLMLAPALDAHTSK